MRAIADGFLCNPTASTGDATAVMLLTVLRDLHFSRMLWDRRENAALV